MSVVFAIFQMFTRKIRQSLKSVTVWITNVPKMLLIFKSVIPMGELVLFSRHAGALVGKFARITDPKFQGIEVSNGNPPKIPNTFYSVGKNFGLAVSLHVSLSLSLSLHVSLSLSL